ncbi:septal ring lytic transglycosylase RlpA family protein [Advenella mimigardefordensis]|uniref:Endolytic peptidoglycan transglycosylase RlpA n=1 Tax=Advenella mimigardefordensis (strain DSM 17166 / LMG 22922 / DPN7) TaxID=1247726 RepID=W0P7D4_ADVMD|nr:septal ring lytic transglycosylase RlpA family protein [Advenella mimigardefordensis]AHG62651.1 RlpA-like domain-containing [Advenella mimigardefordensis DPN7]
MMKRTSLLRSTITTLVTGLFLAPVVHAAGIEIRENQDFSEHMVAPADAVAPGAKAQKPAAPAQKMRITANGVVPEGADDAATPVQPVTTGKKANKADVAVATTPAKAEADSKTLKGSSKPVNSVKTGKTLASHSEAREKSTVTVGENAKALAKASSRQVQKTQDSASTAASAPEEKTTAEVKQANAAIAPIMITAANSAESSKPQLVDGLSMRITENGIIPESEYDIQVPKDDTSLVERKDTKPAADEDIATKAQKALTGTGKAYTVNGIRYKPMSIDETTEFSQEGIASWYGPGFHGRKTANGETFNQNAMTAAHKRLPISSYVRVTRVSTGKSIVVRINDRGPFVGNRVIDLSYGAAKRLGIVGRGSDKVKIEPISKEAATSERNTETQVKAKKML